MRSPDLVARWLVIDQLARFGAIPCPNERYVQDGKIVTDELRKYPRFD